MPRFLNKSLPATLICQQRARHVASSYIGSLVEHLLARSSVSATVRKTYNILSWQQLSLMFHRHRYCARGLRQATIFEVEVAQDDEWIGAVTLKWIGLLKIPTVALVSKSAHKAVELLWRYVRHSPRDGLSLRNKRCTL